MKTAQNPEPDLQPYEGEWVALVEGRVVAHDRDLAKLLALIARRFPDAFLLHVPEEDILIYRQDVGDAPRVPVP